jgi:hypothetical protein
MNKLLYLFLLLAMMTGVVARVGQIERGLQGGLGLCQGDCDADRYVLVKCACFKNIETGLADMGC